MIQEGQPKEGRTRRIALRGVGLDKQSGVFKFAGEPGGPPSTIKLSGSALEAYEEGEARVMNDLYDTFLRAGKSEAEARQLAGIDEP